MLHWHGLSNGVAEAKAQDEFVDDDFQGANARTMQEKSLF